MFKELWILEKRGILLYHRQYSKKDALSDRINEPDLLSGFFTMIDIFFDDHVKDEIQQIVMKKSRLLFYKEKSIILIARVGKNVSIDDAYKKMKYIAKLFISEFKDNLTPFVGETSIFEKFGEKIEI